MRIQCKKTLTAVIVALFLTATIPIMIAPARADYSVTIQAWDSVAGWRSEPIAVDGFYNTGWTTPHTFTLPTGETHTFAVPSTDSMGTPFTQWDTGETTLWILVSSAGTHVAQYYVPYTISIMAWDSVAGWQSVPVQIDGVDSGYNTNCSFIGLTGTNNFAVPSTDPAGGVFANWNNDPSETSTTITCSSGPATLVAQYTGPYDVTIQAFDTYWGWFSEPFMMDGYGMTDYIIPYTFTGLKGTHTFEVPSTDYMGTKFTQWNTGETSTTLTFSSGGTYTAQYSKIATPTFSPPAGTYTSPQTVTISCNASGPTITYTTDGSDPTSYSTVYSGPISVSVTTTIKAKAFYSGMIDSDIASATYTINIPKVATPTFSPPAVTYTSPQTVTVSCDTSGATITFTTDGSEPTSSSTVYSSPIVVGSTTTIKAKAFETGMTDSDTASATYTINIPGNVAYSAAIWSWENVSGWLAEPIQMDGVATGYSTPHNFTGLTGAHTFTVPSTDVHGNPFENWTTGETSPTIAVSADGTYTAQYYAPPSVTIWSWDNVSGWLAEPITMDGNPTGFSTPYSFTGLTGSHTFTVPSTDVHGNPFKNWTTGETNPTITVSSNGTYTAQYYYGIQVPEFPATPVLLICTIAATLLTTFIWKRRIVARANGRRLRFLRASHFSVQKRGRTRTEL